MDLKAAWRKPFTPGWNLEPILSHKKHAADTHLSPGEKTQLRGFKTSLNQVQLEERADLISLMHRQLPQYSLPKIPSPAMEHAHAANEVVRHLKTFPVTLRTHAIPEDQARLVLIADTAFFTSGRTRKDKSKHGWLLGFTNPLMNQGKPAPISLMQWRSKRLRRKASSPLLCEVISLSGGAGAL